MKKKCNVIQINGIGGLLFVIFALCCVATGFILFPSWCCMSLWNLAANYFGLPTMGLLQGGLLWIILALVIFVTHSNKRPIKFGSFTTFENEDIKKKIESLQMKDITNFVKEEDKNDKEDSKQHISKEN